MDKIDAKKLKRHSVAAILSVLGSTALCQHFQLPMMPVAIVLFVAIFPVFFFAFRVVNRKLTKLSWVLSFVFALSCVLAKLDLLQIQYSSFLGVLVRFVGLFGFFSASLTILFYLSQKCGVAISNQQRVVSRKMLIIVFCGAFFVLLGWFMLWLLYRFPGCMSPDSTWQLMQARGLEPLSNHHPIAHTMLIRICLLLGMSVSQNPSVFLATYSIIQASFLAACLAYFIVNLYKQNVKARWIAIVFLAFIILPYHGTYSVTMLKDVWFAGFVLLLIVTVWRLQIAFSQRCMATCFDFVMLFVSSIGMCLFRTNGLYAFAVFLPFIFVFFFKSSKLASIIPTVAFIISIIITGPVYESMDIVPPDTIESLSIPAQQISRAIVEGAELSREENELLKHVVDVSSIPDTYCAWLSDPIKILVRNTGDQNYLYEHRVEYFKLWLELGRENPKAYLCAYIDLTRGYWYPLVDGVVIYPYFTDTENNTDLCLLPGHIASLLASAANVIPRLPLINLLFSNGAAFWIYLVLFAICIVRKRYSCLILFIPGLAVWATLLIATPLDNEFRYAYSLFTTLPLLGVIPFTHVNCHNDEVASQ